MRGMKWFDWLPVFGIVTACYKQAIPPNWFVFIVWQLYQVGLVVGSIIYLLFFK